MSTVKRKVIKTKGLKDYTYLGCVMTKNRTAWCYRMCIPDSNGHGYCGRIAPHSFKSAIQISIENYKKKKELELVY